MPGKKMCGTENQKVNYKDYNYIIILLECLNEYF